MLSLQSKSCLMIILFFMRRGGQLFYQRSRNNNIDIVYDLDKDWFRIFTLERDIY